ncbi:forkhead box protein N3-like isoform X2 [Vanessa cardui]|uniref:forkhead box protein N3-like isoform X1 n=2 Tax=Vanessa cardui TaxID=171605 RepID=UPI001F130800|nr:forkhead box protein N3-like isoform X1 [Vanessa cardui]XP_046967728.1 forkhead box protein N3-like isoform X2 [Vanessa cardui]
MMAPMRGERGGSPARGARASLPLPRRLIRQIARHVASSGRSLRRLEVSGRVIDNFDDIDDASDESDMDTSQPAVACGGNAGNLPPADHDDDLTSLSWLQDRNLLRGINLTKGDMEDSKMISSHVIVKTESKTPPPTSRIPSPPRTPCKAPPSPPAVNTHTKPPYSFSCLIFMAIEAAPARALPVKEIYAWIIRHFPYFKHAPQGWKNSVRHNLSLNKCFHKVAAAPGLGKGSLWTVDPQHRSTLLQAFGRQPVPPVESDADAESAEGKNAPDPQLFPYLARRLADTRTPPGADEYLAAATVLAMKYGPAVLDQLPPEAHLVISRCARDEHSYSGGEERRTAEALLNLAGVSAHAPS